MEAKARGPGSRCWGSASSPLNTQGAGGHTLTASALVGALSPLLPPKHPAPPCLCLCCPPAGPYTRLAGLAGRHLPGVTLLSSVKGGPAPPRRGTLASLLLALITRIGFPKHASARRNHCFCLEAPLRNVVKFWELLFSFLILVGTSLRPLHNPLLASLDLATAL